jgi:hypothetical protein
MYKMQDGYYEDDYNMEEDMQMDGEDMMMGEYDPNCDSAIEDCYDEEGNLIVAKSILVTLWGIVPVMDLVAGIWHLSDWSDIAGTTAWKTTYFTELAAATTGLVFYGGANYMSMDSFFYSNFELYSRVHILLEATMLFLVFNANDKYPNDNTLGVDSLSTTFGFIAHGFGVAYGAASFMAISDEFGAEEEDYYGDDMYADEMTGETDGDVEGGDDAYYGYY